MTSLLEQIFDLYLKNVFIFQIQNQLIVVKLVLIIDFLKSSSHKGVIVMKTPVFVEKFSKTKLSALLQQLTLK